MFENCTSQSVYLEDLQFSRLVRGFFQGFFIVFCLPERGFDRNQEKR